MKSNHLIDLVNWLEISLTYPNAFHSICQNCFGFSFEYKIVDDPIFGWTVSSTVGKEQSTVGLFSTYKLNEALALHGITYRVFPFGNPMNAKYYGYSIVYEKHRLNSKEHITSYEDAFVLAIYQCFLLIEERINLELALDRYEFYQ